MMLNDVVYPPLVPLLEEGKDTMNENIKRRRTAATISKVAALWGERFNVHDPEFNFREIAKQLTLLEEHLCHPGKMCPDCVRKHLLTVEALAEEAVALMTADAPESKRQTSSALSELAKRWAERFNDGESLERIGEEVRQVRKRLVKCVPDTRRELEVV